MSDVFFLYFLFFWGGRVFLFAFFQLYVHNFGRLRDGIRSTIYPSRLVFLGQTEPNRVSIFVLCSSSRSRKKTRFLKKEEFMR